MKYSSCMNRLGCMLTVTALLMGLTSCEERFSESVPAAGEGNPVEVSLSFGFADEEDGYALSVPADTRAGEDGEGGAFSARLAACGEDPDRGSHPSGRALPVPPDAV